MGITLTFTAPFYTGGAVSNLVPGAYPVAIAGHPYLLDLESQLYGHKTIALVRQQADQSDRPGEASLNPEDLWRRSVDSWHKGAGQRYLDRPDSDADRFYTSKGVDPWTKGQIGLLPTTGQKRASANTNLALIVSSGRLYVLDGNTLAYTTNVTATTPTFTSVTTGGTALSTPRSMTSDGRTVWVADATDLYYSTNSAGTYATDTGGGGSAKPASVVRYVKGRLMHGNGAVWSEIAGTRGSATATAVYTHRNTDFAWVDFAPGPNAIYAAGFSGDKSLIYRTAVNADGSALDAPIVAAELPDGEIVRSLCGYLGFLMIGTDKGVRFSIPDNNGDLQLGRPVALTSPPRCFEGQDRFVWFGWSNYDSTSTGLGRLDLSVFNSDIPAYTSDLMVTGQGTVLDVATFQNVRVFAISALGFYAETTSKVAAGTVESGFTTYGLTEPKTALYLAVRSGKGEGTYARAVAPDDGTFTTIGTTATTTAAAADESTATVGQLRAVMFETRLTLTRSSTDTTAGPVINRWTLRADPSAPRRVRYTVPLRLHRDVANLHNQTYTVDVAAERAHIRGLTETRQIVTYQEGNTIDSVIVEDYEWKPYQSAGHPSWEHDGTLVVVMKSV